jgi:hypothetical protein
MLGFWGFRKLNQLKWILGIGERENEVKKEKN